MSYQWEFVNSRKFGDKWGYKVYLYLDSAITCPRGRLDLFMSPEGILTVNTLSGFLADNTGSEIEAFIEQNEGGLTVPVNVDDFELTSPVVTKAADENDKVRFIDDLQRNVVLSTASHQITTLPFSVADTIPSSRWTVNHRTRKINLTTPDVPLICTASPFISKLDLSPLLPRRLVGSYTISDLIAMGATVAEYLTFPVVTAHTEAADW